MPHSHRITTEELTVVIGDNSEEEEHMAGYNGLWHLSSIHDEDPLFPPRYCGMNFEFIAPKSIEDDIEPKDHPTEVEVDEPGAQVTLHQSPTPTHKVESWMTYRVAGPAHLDFTFRFRLHEPAAFPTGVAGFFFASYIQEPENKAIYVLSRSAYESLMWSQFCASFQGERCAIPWEEEPYDLTFGDHEHGLYTSLAPIRYHVPFFFGRRRDMVFAVMFEEPTGVLISHGMGGGGFVRDESDRNPAWDFFLFSRDPASVTDGSWRGRLIYKRFAGRRDILEEYRSLQSSLGRQWQLPTLGPQ